MNEFKPEQTPNQSFENKQEHLSDQDTAQEPIVRLPDYGGDLFPEQPHELDNHLDNKSDKQINKENKGNPVFNFIKEFVIIVGMAIILAFLLKTYIVDSRVVPSLSMYPTVDVGDRFIITKLAYIRSDPKRGDIICFDPPAEMERKDELLKRVIGLPGETLEVKEGKVYINGTALNEPYIADDPQYTYGPITIPQDSYFMMGDNRNHSTDSHLWTNPFIHKKDIEGKVLFRYWPPNRIGNPYTKDDFD